MYKMERILIAIGGKGQRAGCVNLNMSSKCFFRVSGKTLLEIIMEYITEVVKDVEIEIVVTTKEQEEDTHKALKGMDVTYRIVYNNADDVFHLIHGGVNTLIVFGDTYFLNGNSIKPMMIEFIQTGNSQFMLLETDDGIDNVVFDIEPKTNRIRNICAGAQKYEASQIFILSGSDCSMIEAKIKCSNRFEVIYHYIMGNSTCYAHMGDCININTMEQCLRYGLKAEL